jgi:cytoskeletal protein CcmA (bactofilin family)
MFEFSKKGSPDRPEEAGAHEAPRPEPRVAAESTPRAHVGSGSAARRDAAIIGPSIQLDGDLRGQEDLLIEGEVNGTVQLRNNSLTVGSQGKVKANVFAKEIIVDGLVEGDLFGSERVVVRKSAQVRGNITSPRVTLEEGARFKGSIEMDSEAVDRTLGKSRGSSASATPNAGAPRPSATEAPAKPTAPAGTAARTGATTG